MQDEKGRILVVNGDDTTRETIGKTLKAEGHHVETVATGEAALELATQEQFDVLITEMQFPGVGGIEIIKKIKQRIPQGPCMVVITAYGTIENTVEAMKEGAYDYLTKPFTAEEVSLVINRAIEWQKLQREAKTSECYKELAFSDELTEVFNYQYFQISLAREIDRARRYPQFVTLLLIDLDNFKKINDGFGQLAGDKVLKSIGDLLKENTRKTDYVARYGGEEFAVLLPETDKKGASILASRLLILIENLQFTEDDLKEISLATSIGVACYPEDAKDKDELIERADQALYQAKRLGKGRCCLYGVE